VIRHIHPVSAKSTNRETTFIRAQQATRPWLPRLTLQRYEADNISPSGTSSEEKHRQEGI
jgi:hypothetical protein